MKSSEFLEIDEQSALLARREYQRQWRKNNPEKVKAIQQRFYQRQAKRLAAETKKDCDGDKK